MFQAIHTMLWTKCLCLPETLNVGALAPTVMVLGGGAFGR